MNCFFYTYNSIILYSTPLVSFGLLYHVWPGYGTDPLTFSYTFFAILPLRADISVTIDYK